MRRPTWTATLTTYLSTRQRTMTYLDCQTGANHTQPQRILLRLTVTALPERDLPHLGQPDLTSTALQYPT